jgi:hypothetical protein
MIKVRSEVSTEVRFWISGQIAEFLNPEKIPCIFAKFLFAAGKQIYFSKYSAFGKSLCTYERSWK